MTYTEADATLTVLGVCLHCQAITPDFDPSAHAPDCPIATGLGTARGDVVIPGEVCSGCGQAFTVGEAYVAGDDGLRCLGCAAKGV